MLENQAAQGATSEDVAHIVAETKSRLDRQLREVNRLAGATPFTDPFPPAVYTGIRAARRDALTAFGRLLRLETEEPAKGLALSWLSHVTEWLSATYAALREQQLGKAASGKSTRPDRASIARIGQAFLELDRALGCPHGCKDPS